MWILQKAFIQIVTLIIVTIIFYYILLSTSVIENGKHLQFFKTNKTENKIESTMKNKYKVFDIWCIFTKVAENAPFQYKFQNLVKSLVNYTTTPVHMHIISDIISKQIATKIIEQIKNSSSLNIKYSFYDIVISAQNISDIVQTMTPYFSSQPGTYYSDALFYLSLGLYRIAPETQEVAIMVDCDIKFRKDVALLYEEFERFEHTNLFGMTYELTPVYLHALYSFRRSNKHNTTFGDYIHEKPILPIGNHQYGFPGYNSGVVLFNFTTIRKSSEYKTIVSKKHVKRLIIKYKFKGHLGDQDLYTLLGYEYPHLFRTLPCKFNRQLCTWWRDHGYKDIFKNYSICDEDIVIYHGNCNTPIPVT